MTKLIHYYFNPKYGHFVTKTQFWWHIQDFGHTCITELQKQHTFASTKSEIMEKKRIIAFGDSIVKGVITPDNNSYCITEDNFVQECEQRLGVV